jgi:hypothetical protein
MGIYGMFSEHPKMGYQQERYDPFRHAHLRAPFSSSEVFIEWPSPLCAVCLS